MTAVSKSCCKLDHTLWCPLDRNVFPAHLLLSTILTAKYLFREKQHAKASSVKKGLNAMAKAVLRWVMYPRTCSMCTGLCPNHACILQSFLEQISSAQLLSAPIFICMILVSCFSDCIFLIQASQWISPGFTFPMKTGSFKPTRQSSSLLIWIVNKCKKLLGDLNVAPGDMVLWWIWQCWGDLTFSKVFFSLNYPVIYY